jgi:iron complex outermembrane receptor protein
MRYVNFYRTEVSDVSATSHGLDVQPQYQWTFKNILVLTTGLPFGLGFSKSNLYPGTRTNYNAAAFVQAEVNWKRLSWTGGARYEVIGVDVFRETTKPVFRTGLNFRAGKATFLRTSWGQGYRVPTIGERFISAEFSTGIYVIPNRNLLTETGWSFELGLKQGFQINKTWKGYFDFAYFWQEYRNFVQYDLGIFPNKYEDGSIIFPNEGDNIVGMRASNIENARVSGYEVSIVTQGKIGNVGLNMLVGYTYTYPTAAADTTSDPNYDIRRPGTYLKKFFELNGRTPDSLETTQLLQYRNRHLFRADIEATYWKAYVGVSMFYGSFPERIPPLFLAAAIFLFDGGQRSLDKYNAQHRNGDFVFDLRAGVNITPKLKVGFIVKNVTNHFYALRPGRPEPHRNFTAQIRYTF